MDSLVGAEVAEDLGVDKGLIHLEIMENQKNVL